MDSIGDQNHGYKKILVINLIHIPISMTTRDMTIKNLDMTIVYIAFCLKIFFKKLILISRDKNF